jgi:triosephosphate isomerase
MDTPAIVVNFKAYDVLNSRGDMTFARACMEVAVETGVSIAIAPQTAALASIAEAVDIPVFAQHVDAVEPGSRTGRVTAESVKALGVLGTLLNHSERKIPREDARFVVERCQRLSMETIACADDLEEAKAMAALSPTFVAIEPPELIGGAVSVTTADPEIVERAVGVVRSVDPGVKTLCGAGVKTRDDVAKALELGTHGVLLASGVIKAEDPRAALLDLASGL